MAVRTICRRCGEAVDSTLIGILPPGAGFGFGETSGTRDAAGVFLTENA